ncbi:MAG: AAA family ATPase, partial [Bryobacteraceae bacterium]
RRLDPALVSEEIVKFREGLESRVIGQQEAIDKVVMAYQMALAGLTNPQRPVSVFLFLGPTGVGKTRLVEAVAEATVGDPRAVIKVDCGEFQHSHEIAKLIGSPPGYLGHRETHPALSQEVLNQYHTERLKLSFMLFDEIEKASDALWNLMLGILDKATLTLGDNRRVNFSRAMIFMTSNLGAREMQKAEQGFGLAPSAARKDLGGIGQRAAAEKFPPEFMNRVDHTVVFKTLGKSELEKILKIELGRVQERLFNAGHLFVLNVGEGAREELLREGTNAKYGARPLTRTIERRLVLPLSNLITTGQVRTRELRVDYWDGEWEFWGEGEARAA